MQAPASSTFIENPEISDFRHEVMCSISLDKGFTVLSSDDPERHLCLHCTLFVFWSSRSAGVREFWNLLVLCGQPQIPILSGLNSDQSLNLILTLDNLSQVVSAIRYAVVDKPHAVDAALAPSILTFLLLMGDGDRHVRKAAVVALSAAAHQKVRENGCLRILSVICIILECRPTNIGRSSRVCIHTCACYVGTHGHTFAGLVTGQLV